MTPVKMYFRNFAALVTTITVLALTAATTIEFPFCRGNVAVIVSYFHV